MVTDEIRVAASMANRFIADGRRGVAQANGVLLNAVRFREWWFILAIPLEKVVRDG